MIMTVLDKEIAMVEDDEIRRFTKEALVLVPQYFFDLPSSTSGKYHPKDERDEGGLVLHTRRCVAVADDLARTMLLSPFEHSLLISAAILHDTFRCGFENRERIEKGVLKTDPLHAFYPMVAFEKLFAEDKYPVGREVCEIIAQHLGRWSPFQILPSERYIRDLGTTLHIADYIASREKILVDVDNVYTD